MGKVRIKNVAIIGCGVMGTKVAWACAANGIGVHLYDVSSEQVKRSFNTLKEKCFNELLNEKKARAAIGRVYQCFSLEEALINANLAFENVFEDMALKKKVHAEIGSLSQPEVLIGSNTSSLICSPMAEASGRPDQFFNMNFSLPLVELMGNPKTSESTFKSAKEWARAIKMVPIQTKKEIMGYSFNRTWRAIKKEVLFLVDQDYIDPENLDRAFMIAMGTPIGPFGIMDKAGLDTIQKIEMKYYEASGDESDKPPEILNKLVETGHLGEKTGQGFYKWPKPVFEHPGWLKMEPPWSKE